MPSSINCSNSNVSTYKPHEDYEEKKMALQKENRAEFVAKPVTFQEKIQRFIQKFITYITRSEHEESLFCAPPNSEQKTRAITAGVYDELLKANQAESVLPDVTPWDHHNHVLNIIEIYRQLWRGDNTELDDDENELNFYRVEQAYGTQIAVFIQGKIASLLSKLHTDPLSLDKRQELTSYAQNCFKRIDPKLTDYFLYRRISDEDKEAKHYWNGGHNTPYKNAMPEIERLREKAAFARIVGLFPDEDKSEDIQKNSQLLKPSFASKTKPDTKASVSQSNQTVSGTQDDQPQTTGKITLEQNSQRLSTQGTDPDSVDDAISFVQPRFAHVKNRSITQITSDEEISLQAQPKQSPEQSHLLEPDNAQNSTPTTSISISDSIELSSLPKKPEMALPKNSPMATPPQQNMPEERTSIQGSSASIPSEVTPQKRPEEVITNMLIEKMAKNPLRIPTDTLSKEQKQTLQNTFGDDLTRFNRGVVRYATAQKQLEKLDTSSRLHKWAFGSDDRVIAAENYAAAYQLGIQPAAQEVVAIADAAINELETSSRLYKWAYGSDERKTAVKIYATAYTSGVKSAAQGLVSSISAIIKEQDNDNYLPAFHQLRLLKKNMPEGLEKQVNEGLDFFKHYAQEKYKTVQRSGITASAGRIPADLREAAIFGHPQAGMDCAAFYVARANEHGKSWDPVFDSDFRSRSYDVQRTMMYGEHQYGNAMLSLPPNPNKSINKANVFYARVIHSPENDMQAEAAFKRAFSIHYDKKKSLLVSQSHLQHAIKLGSKDAERVIDECGERFTNEVLRFQLPLLLGKMYYERIAEGKTGSTTITTDENRQLAIFFLEIVKQNRNHIEANTLLNILNSGKIEQIGLRTNKNSTDKDQDGL